MKGMSFAIPTFGSPRTRSCRTRTCTLGAALVLVSCGDRPPTEDGDATSTQASTSSTSSASSSDETADAPQNTCFHPVWVWEPGEEVTGLSQPVRVGSRIVMLSPEGLLAVDLDGRLLWGPEPLAIIAPETDVLGRRFLVGPHEGDVLVVGSAAPSSRWVERWTVDGKHVEALRLEGPGDVIWAADLSSTGDLVIGGHADSTMTSRRPEEWDAVLEVFTPEGELVWAAFPTDDFWETSASSVIRVAADPGGIIYVHAQGHPGLHGQTVRLEAYAGGDLVWSTISGGSDSFGPDTSPLALALDGEGSVVELNPTFSACGAPDLGCLWTLRFDTTGDISWGTIVPLFQVRDRYRAAVSRIGDGIVSATWTDWAIADIPIDQTLLHLHDMDGELRCTDLIEGEWIVDIAVIAEDQIVVTGTARDGQGQWQPRLTLWSVDPLP